jgi:Uma2 family endonuclease
MTAVAQLALDDDLDYEIIDGKKEAKMAGGLHGYTIMRLGWRLAQHVEVNKLGAFFSPDTTFLISGLERLPDLSFVTASRIPPDGPPVGKWEEAPDLAIEVISPNDVWEKVMDKVHDYFSAGVQQVWLVALKLREIWIFDAPSHPRVLTVQDEITGEPLLPGFKCSVSELFA